MRRNTRAAACLVLLLAGPFVWAAKAKKDNRANKETVERRLLNHFPTTQFEGSRGPARMGAIVELLKPGLESYPLHAITPAFNYKGGFLRKTPATNLLTQPFLPLPPGTRLLITRIEAHENFVGFDVVTAKK